MKKTLFAALALVTLLGAGCSSDTGTGNTNNTNTVENTNNANTNTSSSSSFQFPVDEYGKRIGQGEAFGDKRTGVYPGLQAGDNVIFTDVKDPVVVRSITDGTVRYVGVAAGYTGVVVVKHDIDGRTINSLYAQIDLRTAKVKAGDTVTAGQELASVAVQASGRKHLHFGLYEGTTTRFDGVAATPQALMQWINPTTFLTSHGVTAP